MALVVTPATGGECIAHAKCAALAAERIPEASAIVARIVGGEPRVLSARPTMARTGARSRRNAGHGGETGATLPRGDLPDLRRDRQAVLHGSCRAAGARVRPATRLSGGPWLRCGLAALPILHPQSAACLSRLRSRPGARGPSLAEGEELPSSSARCIERLGLVQVVSLGQDRERGVGVMPYRAETQDRFPAKRETNRSESI